MALLRGATLRGLIRAPASGALRRAGGRGMAAAVEAGATTRTDQLHRASRAAAMVPVRSLHQSTGPVRQEEAVLNRAGTMAAEARPNTRWLYFKNRMLTSLEITLTKIFPAGFGWQAAAVMAVSSGYADTTLPYFAATGLGDGLAVGTCHFLYMIGKRAVVEKGNRDWGRTWNVPKLDEEFSVACWLTSAAFCSGSLWQPIVNFLHTTDLSFYPTSVLTGVGCGTAFFVGLRAGRKVYPALSSRFANLIDKTGSTVYEDARLSAGIGGAGAVFVCTDFNAVGNPLAGVVGIAPTNTTLEGCAKAGLSTAIGFAGLQAVQNTTGTATATAP